MLKSKFAKRVRQNLGKVLKRQKNRLKKFNGNYKVVVSKSALMPGLPQTAKSFPSIHVIAVAYHRFGELKVFVQSWINQSRSNWRLSVLHDGPSEEFEAIMKGFQQEAPDRIFYQCTPARIGDYGHSLREMALTDIKGDYVMLTNADNYFIPKAVEFINNVFLEDCPDVVMFDMVHSHHNPGCRDLPAYSYFETDYQRQSIDVSSAIVKADLARKAGFRDKTHDGDATYFEDVAKVHMPNVLRVSKVKRILFVHN